MRGSGLKIQDIGSRAWGCGLEFKVWSEGFWGSRVRVQGQGLRVQGLRLRIEV